MSFRRLVNETLAASRFPPCQPSEILGHQPPLLRGEPLQLLPGRQPDGAVLPHELGAERGRQMDLPRLGGLARPPLALAPLAPRERAAGVELSAKQPPLP